MRIQDYVASGYFLSRHAGVRDCSGIELRRVTLAHDHIAACVRPAPLAEGGTVLGHEILIADFGCSFNSPESLHIKERARFQEAGVVPNNYGLIDSFDEALACCRFIESDPPQERLPNASWLPWLIVRYVL